MQEIWIYFCLWKVKFYFSTAVCRELKLVKSQLKVTTADTPVSYELIDIDIN